MTRLQALYFLLNLVEYALLHPDDEILIEIRLVPLGRRSDRPNLRGKLVRFSGFMKDDESNARGGVVIQEMEDGRNLDFEWYDIETITATTESGVAVAHQRAA